MIEKFFIAGIFAIVMGVSAMLTQCAGGQPKKQRPYHGSHRVEHKARPSKTPSRTPAPSYPSFSPYTYLVLPDGRWTVFTPTPSPKPTPAPRQRGEF